MLLFHFIQRPQNIVMIEQKQSKLLANKDQQKGAIGFHWSQGSFIVKISGKTNNHHFVLACKYKGMINV